MRVRPEPGIDEVPAVAAPKRPEPDPALVRPEIREDFCHHRAAAFRAEHGLSSPFHRPVCADASLACRSRERLSGRRRLLKVEKLKPGQKITADVILQGDDFWLTKIVQQP